MEERQVVFIGGFPSGGTDLLKNILNSHPDVNISGEMPFLYNLPKAGFDCKFEINNEDDFDSLKSYLSKYDIWSNLEGLGSLEYQQSDNPYPIQLFLKKAFSTSETKVWGNKTPQNTENIGKLKTLFPEAKFIIIVRDIRDVAISWRKKWGKNMYLTASKWNSRMKFEADQNVLIVKYEDLLGSLKQSSGRIASFLNIPWSENFLTFHDHVTRKVDGKINYGEALKSKNKEKWKTQLKSKRTKRIEEIAYDSLKHYDYPISMAKESKELRWFENLYGSLEDILAMIFVGNRASTDNTFPARLKMIVNQIKIRL